MKSIAWKDYYSSPRGVHHNLSPFIPCQDKLAIDVVSGFEEFECLGENQDLHHPQTLRIGQDPGKCLQISIIF